MALELDIVNLCLPLAKALIKKWKAEKGTIWKDYGNVPEKVADGLRFLIHSEFFDIDDFAKAEGDVGKQVELAIGAIKKFQEFVEMKNIDGVLGNETLGEKDDRRTCARRDGTPPDITKGSIADTQRNTNVIFYYVDIKEPETIGGERVRDLLADAWQMWQEHARITVQEVFELADANVVVQMKPIDNKGGTLGEADVGGPGLHQQLTCILDKDEDWTPRKFTVAACHEFGHILGLHHSEKDGQIMSPVLEEGKLTVIEPAEDDIKRIQRIWGRAPKPGTNFKVPPPDADEYGAIRK